MKFLIVAAALLLAGVITLHTTLENGSFLQYLDAHPHPTYVPMTAYVVGQSYSIRGDLPQAATYFIRVVERYPDSKQADDAYFGYLQTKDDMNTPRAQMADEYQIYLDRFPHGKHKQVVEKRIEFCRNSR